MTIREKLVFNFTVPSCDRHGQHCLFLHLSWYGVRKHAAVCPSIMRLSAVAFTLSLMQQMMLGLTSSYMSCSQSVLLLSAHISRFTCLYPRLMPQSTSTCESSGHVLRSRNRSSVLLCSVTSAYIGYANAGKPPIRMQKDSWPHLCTAQLWFSLNSSSPCRLKCAWSGEGDGQDWLYCSYWTGTC